MNRIVYSARQARDRPDVRRRAERWTWFHPRQNLGSRIAFGCVRRPRPHLTSTLFWMRSRHIFGCQFAVLFQIFCCPSLVWTQHTDEFDRSAVIWSGFDSPAQISRPLATYFLFFLPIEGSVTSDFSGKMDRAEYAATLTRIDGRYHRRVFQCWMYHGCAVWNGCRTPLLRYIVRHSIYISTHIRTDTNAFQSLAMRPRNTGMSRVIQSLCSTHWSKIRRQLCGWNSLHFRRKDAQVPLTQLHCVIE